MKSQSETIFLVKKLLPNRNMRWAAMLIFWGALGTVSAVHWWFLFFGNQPYQEWWVLFRAKILVWTLWGAVTPLILALAAKFRIEKPNFARNIFVLLGYSVVISGAYIILYALAVYWNFPADFPASPANLWRMTHWIYWNHFSYFYLGFWLVVGIEQMLWFGSRSHKREIAAKELENQLADARLAQLRSQIHPHFLFNTLGAISSLIADSDKDRALDAVTRLSNLIRLGLIHGEKQTTSLSEELDFSKEYLELMCVRYPERLTFDFKIGPETKFAEVPSLILQPIIENAVKHGIGTGLNGTHVEVSSKAVEKNLLIHVLNKSSGAGIQDNPAPIENSKGSGIGLKITEERLRHLFGSDYELSVSPNGAGSTLVRLVMPLNLKS